MIDGMQASCSTAFAMAGNGPVRVSNGAGSVSITTEIGHPGLGSWDAGGASYTYIFNIVDLIQGNQNFPGTWFPTHGDPGGGGGGGGPGPQPLPDSENDKSQQADFEKCAQAAIRAWRRAEYPAIGKIAGGTLVGTASTIYGFNAGIKLGSILTSGVRITRFNAGGRILQGMAFGSGILGYFTGDAVVSGFRDSGQNAATKDAAIADCKSEFPGANHGALNLAGISVRTW